MNLLDPKERLEAAQIVAGITDYLESEDPLWKKFSWKRCYEIGELVQGVHFSLELSPCLPVTELGYG